MESTGYYFIQTIVFLWLFAITIWCLHLTQTGFEVEKKTILEAAKSGGRTVVTATGKVFGIGGKRRPIARSEEDEFVMERNRLDNTKEGKKPTP